MQHAAHHPPAYDVDTRRKNALFKIVSATLVSTSEWRTQSFVALITSLGSIFYCLYWMEVVFEIKALAFMCYMFMSAMAMFLSKIVRDRVEADKLEEHAKGTDMYVPSHVDTLRGTSALHAVTWAFFGLAFFAKIYCIIHIDFSHERRGLFLLSGFSLLMQTFTTTKTIRDSHDGDKWRNMYDGNQHRD